MKLQGYDFILQHILGKINMKADILSRKDQVDTMEDNKDVKLSMNKKSYYRSQVIVIRKNQVVKEITLLEEIRRN